jgi:peptidoglycan/xylan/chitin deacetylase (PgdA/CDA1 family)
MKSPKIVKQRRQADKRGKQKTSRASKLILSALAIFVTLVPLVGAGVWAKNTFFSDMRHTVELTVLPTLVTPPKPFDEPLVSVTFDDGWESIYSQGAIVFQKHGIRTTQYILSGTFDYLNYLSVEQVLSLQRAGHDIQSHTVSHRDLTTLKPDELKHELQQSKSDLSKLLGKEVNDFASPLNRYDEKVLEAIGRTYRSHRNTEADIDTLYDGSFNIKDTFDPYYISAFSVRRTTTLPQIANFIEAAKQKNAWIILIYHQIDEKSEDYYAVSQKQLDEQLALIAASGIRVAVISEVLDEYEKKVNQ